MSVWEVKRIFRCLYLYYIQVCAFTSSVDAFRRSSLSLVINFTYTNHFGKTRKYGTRKGMDGSKSEQQRLLRYLYWIWLKMNFEPLGCHPNSCKPGINIHTHTTTKKQKKDKKKDKNKKPEHTNHRNVPLSFRSFGLSPGFRSTNVSLHQKALTIDKEIGRRMKRAERKEKKTYEVHSKRQRNGVVESYPRASFESGDRCRVTYSSLRQVLSEVPPHFYRSSLYECSIVLIDMYLMSECSSKSNWWRNTLVSRIRISVFSTQSIVRVDPCCG